MKNYLVNALVTLIMIVGLISIYHVLTYDKVAYIKNGIVLQKYKGMIDANKQYEKEMAVVKSNLDTLKRRYIKFYELYNSGNKGLNISTSLEEAEKDYNTYREKSEKQMSARQQELTAMVFEKVNLCTQDYGRKHNVKMIFGVTTNGNIMYGRDNDDITEEIVRILNENYDKERK